MREHVLSVVQRHLPGPWRQAGGSNVLTRCPFHKGGQEKKPSFSINTEKGIFHCFTCHVAGGVDKMLRMLGVGEATIRAELAVIQPYLDDARERAKVERQNAFKIEDRFQAPTALPEALLGVFDWAPVPLIEKGFDANLLQRMEIGMDRNLHRITYPLRDMYGNLAGISGGATQFTVNPWPKYKVYQGGRNIPGVNGQPIWQVGDFGEWFDEQFPGFTCENHDYLWNFHNVLPRLQAMSDPRGTVLYVVEGFKACLWMLQHGYENTVALMGSYISDKQEQMLHRLGCTVVLFLDNDEPGRKATIRVGSRLWRPLYGRVKVVPYPPVDDMSQPDDYHGDFLTEMTKTVRDFSQHRHDYLRLHPELRNVL